MARRYMNVGLESEQVVQEEQEQTQAEAAVDQGAENLETELLEVADSEVEGEDREAAIDDAVEVSEELEEDVEDLAVAEENGGIDKYAASILTRATNAKLARIGIAPVRLPATESFGSVSSRQGATRIAMEGIKDKIKEIWKAIVNAIKKGANWVKGHFLKVFSGAEKLKKRAAAVANRVGSMTGKVKKDGNKIENDRLVNALKINQQVPAVGGISASLAILAAAVDKVKEGRAPLEAAIKSLEKVDSAADAKGVAVLAKQYVDVFTKLTGNDASSLKDTPEGSTGKMSNELTGGVVLVTYTNEERTGGNKLAIQPKDAKAKTLEGKSLPTLKVSEVEALANSVEELADSLIQNRKAMDDLVKSKEELAKIAEQLARDAEKLSDDSDTEEGKAKEAYGAARNLRTNVITIDRLTASFPAKLTGFALTTGKAVLDYCELSIKNYEA